MSHNGGFDLPVLKAFSTLPKLGFELTRAVADAPPMILTWRKERRTLKYIDSLNIWRMPLSKLGKSIGMDKLPMPAPEDSLDVWDTYGQRDTDIIRTATLNWFEFLRANDLGGFAPTLAAQSYRTYRHRFMTANILIDNHTAAQEMGRAAYVGGRTECFRMGSYQGDFYYLDVNSMYPSVMRNNLYPTRLMSVYGYFSIDDMAKALTRCAVVAEVDINTDQPDYPLVHDGKLVFPTGQFTVTLCGPELQHALDHGRITRLHRTACYDYADIFTEFIDFMYAQRMERKAEGDEAGAWFFKVIMNSLYGKFGQRGRRYETLGQCDPDIVAVLDTVNADTHELSTERKFGGLIQQWIVEDESRESMPVISAYVSAYARRVLADAIDRAGRDNCWYCDTDSLVVNKAGYERLQVDPESDKLGAWRLDKKISRITINGLKDYVFDDVTRIKGIRHNAKWLSDNTAEQDHFVGFRGLLRRGSLDEPIVYPIKKTLSRIYTKGKVEASGVVTPLCLPDRSGCGGDSSEIRAG
jgi:hypothetical protein